MEVSKQNILGRTLERTMSSQAAEGKHPQRIAVGASVYGATGDLLGGHIVRGAHQHPGGGGEAGRVKLLGDPKIGQQRARLLKLLAQKNITGLDVAMNNAPPVGEIEGRSDRYQHSDELVQAKRPGLLETVLQRAPSQELHRDVGHAVMLTHIVDRHNAWMIERGDHHGLTLEAVEQIGVVAVLRIQNLERNLALEDGIKGTVDHRHPAPSEELFDEVTSEVLIKKRSEHVMVTTDRQC